VLDRKIKRVLDGKIKIKIMIYEKLNYVNFVRMKSD